MERKWKEVDGFPGYFISTHGEVKSPDRMLPTTDSVGVKRIRRHKGRYLRPFTDHAGYLRVDLKEDDKRKNSLVHRLVALAFIPNPENKPCVNHLDGDKKNPHVQNLEWCTHLENMRHGHAAGLIPPRILFKGEKSIGSKLTNKQALAIKKRLAAGEPVYLIAADYPVGSSAIREIKAGRCWSHLQI